MARRLFLLGILLLALSWQIVSAQYRFDSWTTDNGLPQNGIREIVQTPDGYLWFTTFDGLVRFDGVKFTVFDKGNTKGIINNRFATLYAAPDGTLWAGTEEGVLTIYRNGVFTSIDATEVPGNFIHSFHRGENGETRILADRKFYYLRDGQFVFDGDEEQQGAEKKIFVSPSGTKWTITAREVRQLKTDERETIYPVKVKDVSKIDVEFRYGIYEDRDGGLWFSEIGRLYNLHEGKVAIFGEREGIAAYTFPHDFWEESDGSLWFTTGDKSLAGVGIFQIKDGKFNRFGVEQGLSNDRIMSVFKDREGTIWIATNKGLNRMRREIITSLSVKDGLIHNEVYPILQGKNDEVLIGTAQGLSRYRQGKFINNGLGDTESGFANIQALFEERDGRLWAGVVGGLHFLENGKLTDMGPIGTTNSIIKDRNENLWVGTGGNGIYKFNAGRNTANYKVEHGLPDNEVKVIYEAKDGTLWIGTYGGIAISDCGLRISDCQTRIYTTENGLPSNRIRSIYEDAEGVFWVGTYDGGLSRFKDGKFFNFTTDNGLFNNGVFAIMEDDSGNFWISCNKGIYRVNKRQLNDFADGSIAKYESFSYGKEDGMRTTECNGGRQPSALKDKDGRFWFPTLEGVAIVNPKLIIANQMPPPVEIETVAIDREALTAEKLQSAIRHPQSAIEIGASQTSLDITYTGLSFIKSDQIRFKYKLEGLDKDWIDAGTRRTVNYSYLPSGEYTFTVMAANADGVWNISGKSIKIAVNAPFYKTWKFWALLCLIFVGLGLLIYRNRVNQLKELHSAQEVFSRQLIESQEKERKRIAAELHDSLGQNLLVIKNRAMLGLSFAGEEKTKKQFDEIQDSVTVALSEVRSIAYNLRPLHLERLGLTSTIKEMIKQTATASEIKINFEIEPIDDLFSKENEINFYRVMQECLNNIVKHSQATKATVIIYRHEQNVLLTVRDNGRGFDLIQSTQGLGLNGIAERVKILGGAFAIESEIGEGTTISIEIEGVNR